MEREEIRSRIFELKLQGYCCSQIVMEIFLAKGNKKNEDLIEAMSALCGNIGVDKTCGVVTAAWCVLHIADPKRAEENVEELNDWFEDAFGEKNCKDILQGIPTNKVEKCPVILEAVMLKIAEILEWED